MNKKKPPPTPRQINGPARQSATRPGPSIAVPVLLLLLIAAVTVFIRVRWLDFPLERDEGEYALFGQMILNGIPPYAEAYNMKLPGTYLMYALIMSAFGQSPVGIHIGLLIVNLLGALFIFLIGKKLANVFYGAVAGACYLMLSTTPGVLGFAAHATHFIVLFATAGTWLTMVAIERRRWWLFSMAGILLGIGFLMKQPGAFFVLFGIWLVAVDLFRNRPLRFRGIISICLLGIGSALPFVILLLLTRYWGVFDNFWFWSFTYLSKYGTALTLDQGIWLLKFYIKLVVEGYLIVWLLAIIGLLDVTLRRTQQAKLLFMIPFVVLSVASMSAGLHFRDHYFVTLLPAVALLVAAALDYVRAFFLQRPQLKGLSQLAPALVLVGLAVLGYSHHKDAYFNDDVDVVAMKRYGANPLIESRVIASFVADRTSRDERILVFGSEPQIYFYAHRLPATAYVYAYPLMEVHPYVSTMQQEMMKQVEGFNPSMIVLVNVELSWLRRPKSDMRIHEWFKNYVATNQFVLVGSVDITGGPRAVYHWNEDARQYKNQSPNYIHVLRRVTAQG
jgi:4-amino-4-deoxy-L-arabinose transferase-like glycosyltransferase